MVAVYGLHVGVMDTRLLMAGAASLIGNSEGGSQQQNMWLKGHNMFL